MRFPSLLTLLTLTHPHHRHILPEPSLGGKVLVPKLMAAQHDDLVIEGQLLGEETQARAEAVIIGGYQGGVEDDGNRLPQPGKLPAAREANREIFSDSRRRLFRVFEQRGIVAVGSRLSLISTNRR